jgi:adenosylcobalamin-dependent ribonucleoside-triphosphate reductase
MFLSQTKDGRKIRSFTLSELFIKKYKGQQPNWGFNNLGYLVFKRTYARQLENGNTEEFWQTVKRVVEGVYTVQKEHCKTLSLPWDDRKAQSSAQEMFERMWQFKFLPPGRGLWAMGTDLIYKKGSAALNNCAFVTTENIDINFAEPFLFLMDMSMYGVGVGGDCKGAGKLKLQPMIHTVEETHFVDDSREGWVAAVKVVLDAAVGKCKVPVFDYSKVRPKGALIKGFGGIASGPGPLKDLIENLINLLQVEASTPITSTHIVDIFNYIGKCVVSGGVRRTAEIMFGDQDDTEFVDLKQDKKALYDRRWASNNSIFATAGMDYQPFVDRIASNGEPGFIWLDHMKEYGRMSEPKNNKDRRAMGSNPCSEQTLEDHELCCLVETFPAHHESLEDYKRTLKFAYLYGKSVTLIPTHNMKTNAVMMRNRRIGTSMSGITQAITKLGRYEFLNWCNNGYSYIKELDRTYSDWLCIPRSIKVTSVKPSGTVSLLAGSTPGIHYPYSEYYIRRIRMQDSSPLIEPCKTAGYHVEKDAYATDTVVVEFPVKSDNFEKSVKDATIWEQFQNAADLQSYWADNQVSITVSFKHEEAKHIKTCLEMYERKLKSISLLPPAEDAGYKQLPYEQITKDEYYDKVSNIKPLDLKGNTHDIESEDKFCDGDNCTI